MSITHPNILKAKVNLDNSEHNIKAIAGINRSDSFA